MIVFKKYTGVIDNGPDYKTSIRHGTLARKMSPTVKTSIESSWFMNGNTKYSYKISTRTLEEITAENPMLEMTSRYSSKVRNT
jgi:hypothetical protein